MSKSVVGNPELQLLVELQALDQQTADLRKRLHDLPGQLAELTEQIEDNRRRLEEARQKVTDHSSERRALEDDLELLRSKLSRYKTQLMEVKTNKEYQAMLHEISGAEQAIAEKEDLILEQMMESEEWESRAVEIEAEVRERDKNLIEQRRKLEDFGDKASAEMEQRSARRDSVLTNLAAGTRELYERIARARDGTAMAEAKDQSCQICHVRLRPQLFNEIKTNQQIITCENCNRILYYAGN